MGRRREVLVDRFMVDSMTGLEHRLHEPRPAPDSDQPADALEYGTVILDRGKYRLYTRDGGGARFDGDVTEVTRYCESRDGIHWVRPKLGLIDWKGSRENNIILHEAPFCHNFCPMLDRRPGVSPDKRYKALAGTVKSGLFAFVSSDGLRWSKLKPEPVITYTKEYAFDSQNVSFWSEVEKKYVCYFRHFLNKSLRSVCRTTSTDYLKWSEPVPMKPNFPGEHLYTTLTHPYFRAPHIYIALPTRFHPDRGESTDILFMTARGDSPFDRTFREAFLRPGLDPARWGNRSNYAALNIVPTGPDEMSIYVSPFRRFTLRLDGFASLRAGADPGQWTSRVLTFQGDQLRVNYSTSAAGLLQCELLGADGKPIEGFSLDRCQGLVGDKIDQVVSWTNQPSLAKLQGRPVRLRFQMREADLFSFRFALDNANG